MENHEKINGKTAHLLIRLCQIITIAFIDDHKIFCDSLATVINDFEEFSVSWCAQDEEGNSIALTLKIGTLNPFLRYPSTPFDTLRVTLFDRLRVTPFDRLKVTDTPE